MGPKIVCGGAGGSVVGGEEDFGRADEDVVGGDEDVVCEDEHSHGGDVLIGGGQEHIRGGDVHIGGDQEQVACEDVNVRGADEDAGCFDEDVGGGDEDVGGADENIRCEDEDVSAGDEDVAGGDGEEGGGWCLSARRHVRKRTARAQEARGNERMDPNPCVPRALSVLILGSDARRQAALYTSTGSTRRTIFTRSRCARITALMSLYADGASSRRRSASL
jgi:hypothetical protein